MVENGCLPHISRKFLRLLFKGQFFSKKPVCKGKIAVSIQYQDELIHYQDFSINLHHEGWQGV